MQIDLTRHIRDIPDFPKPGILFKDITPLLADGPALRWTPSTGSRSASAAGSTRCSASSRAASSSARRWPYASASGSRIVRKPGKLPWQTHSASYELEYGTDSLEIHQDAFGRGRRVLLVDDLLATGGTARAATRPRAAARGRGGRGGVPDRARLPRRPRAPRAGFGALAHPLRLTRCRTRPCRASSRRPARSARPSSR